MRTVSGRFLELFLVAFLLGVIALGILYAQFGDELTPVPGLTSCRLEQATGLECPTCGGTRALRALMNGDLGRAIQYNLLVVLTLPLVVTYTVWAAVLVAKGFPLSRLAVPAFLPWAWLAFVVTFTVMRNLP